MAKKQIILGESDFRSNIIDNGYYVDKSLFIKDVVLGAKVYLFARPRRFGKTLNLSMLNYFYDNTEDYSGLFTNLKISSEPEIMQKQGKHPVIYMTFKDINKRTWEDCFRKMQDNILDLIYSFRFILNSDSISDLDRDLFQRILSRTADKADYERSLKRLL